MRRGVEITGLVWTHFKGVRGLEGGGSDLKGFGSRNLCQWGNNSDNERTDMGANTGASFDGK